MFGSSYKTFSHFLSWSFSLSVSLSVSVPFFMPLGLITEAGKSLHSPGPHIEAILFNLLDYSGQENEAEFCVSS